MPIYRTLTGKSYTRTKSGEMVDLNESVPRSYLTGHITHLPQSGDAYSQLAWCDLAEPGPWVRDSCHIEVNKQWSSDPDFYFDLDVNNMYQHRVTKP